MYNSSEYAYTHNIGCDIEHEHWQPGLESLHVFTYNNRALLMSRSLPCPIELFRVLDDKLGVYPLALTCHQSRRCCWVDQVCVQSGAHSVEW